MKAFAYASGLIEFAEDVPQGAQLIASGRAKPLRDFIEGMARHGYHTENVNGRPTKIPGSDHLLVPNVPEASGSVDKIDALSVWLDRLKEFAPKGIEVR